MVSSRGRRGEVGGEEGGRGGRRWGLRKSRREVASSRGCEGERGLSEVGVALGVWPAIFLRRSS